MYYLYVSNTNKHLKQTFKVMQRKFKIGDMVGWRSDSDFTKENKNKPAQKVVAYRKCPDTGNWNYRITNYLGWQMEHELELRS